MIPVGRLAPGGQWDQTLLDDLFDNRLYPTGLEFKRVEGYPNSDGCVLIVPGRYWHDRVDDVRLAVKGYDWVLAIRVGDEEDLFDISKVTHPNIKWWIQTPRVGRDYGDARFVGIGYTPHARFSGSPPEKYLDVFLSGQNTHARRAECFAALKPGDRRRVEQTSGFTEGMDPVEYAECMYGAQVAPAPSGAVSPDSFRLYEALEAHAVPIADDVSPTYPSEGFWRSLYPDAPFPILANYADLPGYVGDVLADWPASANRVAVWWMREKRRMAMGLVDDLKALGAL